MATVDASIPLGFQQPQIVNPAQLISMRNAMQDEALKRQLLQMQIAALPGQQQQERAVQAATLSELQARTADYKAQAEERTQKRVEEIQSRRVQFSRDATASAVDAYDRAVSAGGDPATAKQRAVEVIQKKIEEAEASGNFTPDQIAQMKAKAGDFNPDQARSTLVNADAWIKQYEAQQKPGVEPPKTIKDPKTGKLVANPDYLEFQKKESEAKREPLAERVQVAKATAEARNEAQKTGWSDQEKDLLASLASYNVNLPVGMRSKDQIHATLQGLLDRNKGKTSDEIAQDIQSGKIELAAKTSEARTAGTGLGRIAWATNEIDATSPLLLEASAHVPRTSFMPINKLLRLYREGGVQDPNQRELAVYVNSMLNAYDLLAARGGTDVEKRKEAHSLLTSADSPEALERGVQAFRKEAQASRTAAERTIGEVSGKGDKTANDWVDRAMKANPGMTREQVIAEGKRLGKL